MTDFHSHILPGIDDGSPDAQTSVLMLQMEAAQGIDRVVATPHFYSNCDHPDAFLARRSQAEQILRREADRFPGLPELHMGAEVSYFRGMSESECLPLLAVRDSGCILIEMPPAPWPEEAFRELEAIQKRRGLMPVIAHVERYIQPIRPGQLLKRLAELPVLVQANADFFCSRKTAHLAMRLLKADQIQLLGSDCHNLSTRKPNLGDAIARIDQKLGREVLERIGQYEGYALNFV